MLVIIGAVVVLGAVIGGYAASGGHLMVLWQPFEFIIIFGAAIGSVVIANPKAVLTGIGRDMGAALKGSPYSKESYLELLSLLYTIFKVARTKGALALEQHIENPHESTVFQQFQGFYKNHHAVVFLCDYLRLVTLGTENAHEMESLMLEELETHHAEQSRLASALQTVADGMPALGIVAAVLGVIHTMGSITEPPEVLGHLIGGALVGTFMGVLLSYGFVGPIANAIKNYHEAEGKYFQCMKAGILAHVQGYAPAISIEFARKALMSEVRPTFQEVEEATGKLVPV
jgi:chemotaxis protein MotA